MKNNNMITINKIEPLLLLCGILPRRCSNCRFWRDKGWDGEGNGTGICDNKYVINQVTIISEEHLKKFVNGDTEQDKKYNARWISTSMRFSDKFCCCHYRIMC